MIAERKHRRVIEEMPISTMDLDMTNNCVLACECCVPVFTGIRNFRGDKITVLGIVFFENLWGLFNFFWRF